jgi:hypothetical protein
LLLADLLALIPDAPPGNISAADLRDVVTALYNQPKLSFDTRWSYNAGVGINPPNQDLVFNHADPGSATWVRFSNLSKDNWDMDGALLRLQVGAWMHLQDANDSTRWLRAEVSGAPTAVAGPPASVQVPFIVLTMGVTTGWTADVVVLFGTLPLA